MKIKYSIGTGYSGCTHEGEFDIEDFGYTEEEWLSAPESERRNVLNDVRDNALGEHIDIAVWYE